MEKKSPWIIIDEVQKAPKLLDVVHSMIEREKVYFALTGSSARKIKRGQANLLAGRAWSYHLFPLCAYEVQNKFELLDALHWGTLPKIYQYNKSNEKLNFLDSYANTYLK